MIRFQGEAEGEITRLFRECEQYPYNILLMDDIDQLCAHRSSINSGTENELQKRLVSCLL